MSEFFSKLFPLLWVSYDNFVIDKKLHHIAFLNIFINLIIYCYISSKSIQSLLAFFLFYTFSVSELNKILKIVALLLKYYLLFWLFLLAFLIFYTFPFVLGVTHWQKISNVQMLNLLSFKTPVSYTHLRAHET